MSAHVAVGLQARQEGFGSHKVWFNYGQLYKLSLAGLAAYAVRRGEAYSIRRTSSLFPGYWEGYWGASSKPDRPQTFPSFLL